MLVDCLPRQTLVHGRQASGRHGLAIDAFAQHLAEAGFNEVQRLQHQFADRPDRKYAAIAARVS